MRITTLAACVLLAACAKSTISPSATQPAAPTATAPTARHEDPAQSALLKSVEGRWSMNAGAAGLVTELHYKDGRLLGRGATLNLKEMVMASLTGRANLFIIEPAGDLDEANHQILVTVTSLPSSCKDQEGGLSFSKDHEEAFENDQRIMGELDAPRYGNGIYPAPPLTPEELQQAAQTRSQTLADVAKLIEQMSEERDSAQRHCNPTKPAGDTMTLKNLARDPSNSVRLGFVLDSGEVVPLSFIRKLTAAESAEIERAHMANGEEVAKANEEMIKQFQEYDDGLLTKMREFRTKHGAGLEETPGAQSSGPTAATAHSEEAARGAASPVTNGASNSSPTSSASARGDEAKAVAPSFDCGKASTGVEKMICADPSLAAADFALAASYAKARASATDPASLRSSQRDFLQTRNSCTAIACISEAYRSRAAELARPVSSP